MSPWPRIIRSRFVHFTLCAVMVASAGVASAQGYPDRPVRVIVSFPPGGTGDAVARVLAHALAPAFKAPIVVENQGGAAGAIGAGYVARAQPDGYVLLFSATSVFSNLPLLTKTQYDPIKDFAPIAMIADSQRMLAANTKAPFQDLKQLVAYAKANPGKVTYGSSGNGSTPHILTEVFARSAGIKLLHVPYKGAGPALTGLLSGDVDFMIDTVVIPHAAQGKLRAIVAVGEKLEKFPNLPSLKDEGFASVRTSGWTGLFAPAGVPPSVIEILAREIQPLFSKPEFISALRNRNVLPRHMGPREFAAYIREDYDYFAGVIREAGIRYE